VAPLNGGAGLVVGVPGWLGVDPPGWPVPTLVVGAADVASAAGCLGHCHARSDTTSAAAPMVVPSTVARSTPFHRCQLPNSPPEPAALCWRDGVTVAT
jgi:hypothetical protein